MKSLQLICVAGAFALGLCSVAEAGPAVVRSAVNIRSGPGTNFSVIGQLPRGINVEILGCTPAWCSISWSRTAYVAASYLVFERGPPVSEVAPVVVNAVPAPPVAAPIIVAPPVAPLVYAPPPPVLFYPPPPRFYGPPPAPGPYYGVGIWSW